MALATFGKSEQLLAATGTSGTTPPVTVRFGQTISNKTIYVNVSRLCYNRRNFQDEIFRKVIIG
jgi:hypothetical protein